MHFVLSRLLPAGPLKSAVLKGSQESSRKKRGAVMFQIEVLNLGWIIGDKNNQEDLCLHGQATVTIGSKKLEYEATVSAAALYLLKSLTEDHLINQDNQLLPCCGFFMIADDTLENVTMCGCPNGIDWSVLHEGDRVRLILEEGEEIMIPFEDYQKEVFQFADKIEAFYQASLPRKLPDEEFERKGYQAFWNEWHRRRHDMNNR